MAAFALSAVAKPTMERQMAAATTAMRMNAPMPLERLSMLAGQHGSQL
jgi:hypothetical protein